MSRSTSVLPERFVGAPGNATSETGVAVTVLDSYITIYSRYSECVLLIIS